MGMINRVCAFVLFRDWGENMSKQREQKQYLKDYPKLNKWVNECVVCHAKGYNPRIELKEEKIVVSNLKKILPPLELDESKMCPVCAKLLQSKR